MIDEALNGGDAATPAQTGEALADEIRIPGISDCKVRRHRIFSFDFDSRPMDLASRPDANWSEEARARWHDDHADLISSLNAEYGEDRINQKIEDFASFGAKPFSIISHHNKLFNHVRTAFVSGAYYAALTGACALGERILNHLMLDLRDHFRGTPEYKSVYRKNSFDRWGVTIDTLSAWNVLLSEVADEFRALELLRNRSIHFTADTANRLRDDALAAAHHLGKIIEGQFSAFGRQPWFIEGTLGAGFIKQGWEAHPFVAHYYCTNNVRVGPFHSVDYGPRGFEFIDHTDYGIFGVDALTDEQFKDSFNGADDECRARRNPPADENSNNSDGSR